jgi:DNA-directed RNA polymerase specialized sigma24 family protein
MNGLGRAIPAEASDADWAVTALFRDHHLELVRLALVMVGDVATAEDVVQDAFEHLHKRWPRLREPGSGLAYARSSVLNGCRSVHRRSAVARKHVARLAGPSGAGPDAEAAW